MEALFRDHVSPLGESSSGGIPTGIDLTSAVPLRQSVRTKSSKKNSTDFSKYPYIIVGSGMAGGALARKLMTDNNYQQPRVLLLEKGGLGLHTHSLNTSRVHFAHQSQEGRGRDNEVMFDKYLSVHNTEYQIESREQDSQCAGGSVFELGGRSLFWSLETPAIRTDRLKHFFPSNIVDDLAGSTTTVTTEDIDGNEESITQTNEGWYMKAQRIMANSPPGDAAYPQEDVNDVTTATVDQVTEAKWKLANALHDMQLVTTLTIDNIEATPNGAEFGDSNNLYYFPQHAYSTSDWIQDKVLNQASGSNQPFSVHLKTPVNSLTVEHGLVSKMDINGTSFKVGKDQKVVLCAGTVNTAAIALRSTGLPDGVKNKVGKNLTDHEIWMSKYWQRLDGVDTYKNQKAVEISCYVTVNDKEALLTVCQHAERFYGHGFANGEGDTDAEIELVSVLNIMFEFEAELDSKGKVTLKNGEPVLDINVAPESQELRAELEKLCKAIREQFKFTDDGTEGGFDDHMLQRAKWGSVAHEVGTMRMDGPDCNDGVVDSNLMVKGVENLFVCDLSVFPFSPMENPSLTVTALAMRLGDHLL
ncbi:FAD/NAD(P)-binding domain-containing protein [Xylariaceae sp. FL1272]|nr:FAD/NAD(P)-binding domain-containing protein [Xylariaceae sp. FL1272]